MFNNKRVHFDVMHLYALYNY